MMDELVKLIMKKTGLPEAKARTAAIVAVDFIKSKLPAPVAGQIDALMTGKGAGDIVDMAEQLGGLMSDKKKKKKK